MLGKYVLLRLSRRRFQYVVCVVLIHMCLQVDIVSRLSCGSNMLKLTRSHLKHAVPVFKENNLISDHSCRIKGKVGVALFRGWLCFHFSCRFS